MPIRLFRHSAQTIYSKTRGGVDGSSQARSILRCSTNVMKWEQKVVSHVLKTISTNAFIGWRMMEREEQLQTKETFRGISQYRKSLNDVQSQADYIHDVAGELLDYAEKYNEEELLQDESARPKKVNERELIRLCNRAKKRRRNRIQFFNSGDGLVLRLAVKNHRHCQGELDIYCALCGQNRDSTFRGHRCVNKCAFCHVHLCLKTHQGFRKSCWDVWHTARRLKPRAAIQLDDSEDDEGEMEDDEPMQLTARKKRRLTRESS